MFERPVRHRAGWSVLAVIATGGALGSLARWALAELFPTRSGEFAWATFFVNVSGCLLIGVLMVLVAQVWGGRPLLRPFVGVGLLGGYTTFSTYVVDFGRLVADGAMGLALAYLAGTLVAGLAATYLGMTITARLIDRNRGRR
jgi:CrcB protein